MTADGDRLALAIDALLENAVQHTGPGDLIRLSAVRCPDEPAVSLVVQDSGPGIPPADAAHIFERFRTGSAPRPPRRDRPRAGPRPGRRARPRRRDPGAQHAR